MEYRILPHGNEKISVIGLGMGSIHLSPEKEIEQTVTRALDSGINFFDMAASERKPYACYARAFDGRRSQIVTQLHFGADYETGTYGWTRDLEKIKKNFNWELEILQTDYTDVGYIHCIDDIDDYHKVMKSGIWDYIKGEKESGRVHHLGFSSHSPEMARRLLDTGMMDIFMFSINPAYDYTKGDYGLGSVKERAKLYRECEMEGVGIAVMKPFGGGQLLNAGTSPFRRALTKNQCIQYALDRPAVVTVLPGVRGIDDLEEVLTFTEAAAEEKDYSLIGEFTPQDAEGNCVYCNHCQPCPQNINVGLVNKYYDLAKAGDVLASGHYDKLNITAASCVGCGHCDKQCPFHVKQTERMKEIRNYFGK